MQGVVAAGGDQHLVGIDLVELGEPAAERRGVRVARHQRAELGQGGEQDGGIGPALVPRQVEVECRFGTGGE